MKYSVVLINFDVPTPQYKSHPRWWPILEPKWESWNCPQRHRFRFLTAETTNKFLYSMKELWRTPSC